MHCRESGVCDHYAENDTHALAIARAIVARLRPARRRGSGACRAASRATTRPRLYGVLPASLRKPYDVREVIARLVDDSRAR